MQTNLPMSLRDVQGFVNGWPMVNGRVIMRVILPPPPEELREVFEVAQAAQMAGIPWSGRSLAAVREDLLTVSAKPPTVGG